MITRSRASTRVETSPLQVQEVTRQSRSDVNFTWDGDVIRMRVFWKCVLQYLRLPALVQFSSLSKAVQHFAQKSCKMPTALQRRHLVFCLNPEPEKMDLGTVGLPSDRYRPTVLQQLSHMLKQPKHVKSRAVMMLQLCLGDATTVVEQLQDADHCVRQSACEALGQVEKEHKEHEQQALIALWDTLEDGHAEVRRSACEGIRKIHRRQKSESGQNLASSWVRSQPDSRCVSATRHIFRCARCAFHNHADEAYEVKEDDCGSGAKLLVYICAMCDKRETLQQEDGDDESQRWDAEDCETQGDE